MLVLILVLAGLAWWETHPNVFGEFGDGAGITNRPGSPALIVLSWPGGEVSGSHTVHILAVSPHLRSAPPGTTIHTVWCSRRWADGSITTGRGSLPTNCRDSRPAAGSTLNVGRHIGDQLLLVIQRDRPGTVVVDGATITYRTGLRFGRQHIGVVATAEFTPTAVG